MNVRRNSIAWMRYWLLALLLCGGCGGPPPPTPPAPPTYRVIGVLDGDTLEVLRDNETTRVRLHGVDCPEHDQPFGQRAKKFTSDLAFGQDVTLEERDTDPYGRLVAEVFLSDGRSLNMELVRAGLAWHYKRYSKDPALAAAEVVAREAKLGLWSHKEPVPPWEWRRKERVVNDKQPPAQKAPPRDKMPAKPRTKDKAASPLGRLEGYPTATIFPAGALCWARSPSTWSTSR